MIAYYSAAQLKTEEPPGLVNDIKLFAKTAAKGKQNEDR